MISNGIQNNYNQSMEMKINLDQIFGSSSTNQTVHNSQYQSYQASQSGSLASYHNQNRYRINMPIFSQQIQQTSKPTPKPIQSKTPSVISVQTQYSQKTPGERLYYQSKATIARKKQQLEKIKIQQSQEQLKQMTFKPKINKNSQKLAQNRQKIPRDYKKQSSKVLPTHLKKQQQQIMHCTFKPELIAKSTSGQIRYKTKGQIFEQLFNDHKVKQVKKKISNQQIQQEIRQQKKLTKAEFQSFLARNNQFKSKVEKKKQLIISTSTKFDLQTGNKLFSPQTNSFKSHKNYFSDKPLMPKSTRSIIDNFKTQSIFNKNKNRQQNNQQQYHQQFSPQFRTKPAEEYPPGHNTYNMSRSPDGNAGSKNYQNNIFQLNKKQVESHQNPFRTPNSVAAMKINQVDQIQDEDHEVTDEEPHFQTVRGIQFGTEKSFGRNIPNASYEYEQNQQSDPQNSQPASNYQKSQPHSRKQMSQKYSEHSQQFVIQQPDQGTMAYQHHQSTDQITEQTPIHFYHQGNQKTNQGKDYEEQDHKVVQVYIEKQAYHQQQQPVHHEVESPIRNEEDKASDFGETHHSGGGHSRFQE